MPFAVIYPQLDGIKINQDRTLPTAVIQAIRKAYDYIAASSTTSSIGTSIIQDTHANRATLHPAVDLALGSLYLETDRLLMYIVKLVSSANTWVYLEGTYARTQAQLAALATTLTVNDNGLLINVSNYGHLLKWTNPAWGWAPGEQGSGFFCPFAVAPTASGWVACNGASVAYLKSDGTTGSVTLPNTAGTAAYIQATSAYANAITAATVPTISAPAFTGTPVTPTGTVGAIAATASGSILVTVVGATPVADQAHTHPAPTFTGNALTPAGTVAAPTATLPADPVANFHALLYFRQ